MVGAGLLKGGIAVILLLAIMAAFDAFGNIGNNQITGAYASSAASGNAEIPTYRIAIKPGWNIVGFNVFQNMAPKPQEISDSLPECTLTDFANPAWSWSSAINDFDKYQIGEELKLAPDAAETKSAWVFGKNKCSLYFQPQTRTESFTLGSGWSMVSVAPNWAGNKLSDVLESGCDFKIGWLYDQEKGWLPEGGLTLDYTFTAEDVGKGFWMYITGGCATKEPVKPITKIVTGCGEITESGDYALGNDITVNEVRHVPEETCLNIHDSNKINVDCKGHSITTAYDGVYAIGFFNVNDFSLKNCILTSRSWAPLFISKSEEGAVSDNTFVSLSTVRIKQGNSIAFKKNTFNTMYEQFYSNNNVLQDNDFSPISISVFPGVILFDSGSGNKISDNTIDGKSNGVFNEKSYDNIAADDGIIIKDENGDVIQDNTIVNVWDCGIETDGTVSDTKFSGNTISNAGLCGIGGWYFNSWKNNIVNGNSVSNTPMLFLFFRTWGLRPAGSDELKILPHDDAVYFLNNQFSDNRITDNAKITPYSVYNKNSAYISITATSNLQGLPGERGVTTKDLIVGNNKFAGNNFGITKSAPFFNPEDMIVDGGGNTCSKPTDTVYPLNCGNN